MISIVQGDITTVEADAIVNAANSELAAGGGVCGAIFRAAGPDDLSAACNALGRCPTGSAVITPAFAIETARFIIHAVGPVYTAHPEAEARRLLRSTYTAAIDIARDNGCKSIAFPAISTGIYGYPLDAACHEAVDVCRQQTAAGDIAITLVAFDETTANCLRRHHDGTA